MDYLQKTHFTTKCNRALLFEMLIIKLEHIKRRILIHYSCNHFFPPPVPGPLDGGGSMYNGLGAQAPTSKEFFLIITLSYIYLS
jgi:hypothetical protein